MIDLNGVYKRFGDFLPALLLEKIERAMLCSGAEGDVKAWAGAKFFVAFLFALAGALLPWTLLKYANIITLEFETLTLAAALPVIGLSVLLGTLSFITAILLYYMHAFYVIDDRTKRLERVLPDFLLIVVSNLRAGMTPFAAFRAAARPEFGPLEEEIRVASAKAGASESLSEALRDLSKRFNSGSFQRAVEFFDKGIRSGGQLAKLLESSAEETRRLQDLKSELVATTRTYAIFLVFIVIAATPFLLAISTQFLAMFNQIQSETQAGASEFSLPFFSTETSITQEFMIQLSMLTLIGTSLFVAALIGVIIQGQALYGAKYFPILAIISTGMFLLAKIIIASILSAFA